MIFSIWNNLFNKVLKTIIISKIIIIIINIYIINYNIYKFNKKVGIIGLKHSQNIGNNLLKYAIFIKLSELGFDPYIVGKRYANHNISFIHNNVKLRLIKNNFHEIKKEDYDILMVNSDQTWRQWDNDFYDIAFLKFAKNWNIIKFIYGASLGYDNWKFSKKDQKIAKYLLKNFTGISVREKGSIKYIEKHLGFKPILVLDPTLLINQKYYLKLIKNYKDDFIGNNYIFTYILSNGKFIKNFITKVKKKLKSKIYFIDINTQNQIKKFIYGIYNCRAVITDSYHGTIFSIIFNKPFISFVDGEKGRERFNTLKEVFGLKDRIFNLNSIPNISLLKTPLNFKKNLLTPLKKQSIDFLKKNLNS